MQRVLAQRGRAVLALAALRATTVRATATAAATATAPGSFLQKPAKEHSLADINQTYLADANTPGFAALFNARESSWIKARGHFGILVREPAIKVIDHLRAVAQGKVEGPKRVILHGKEGCGKSVTLAYIAHVCSNSGWLVARVPSALKWTHKSGSREPCARDPKRIDQYEDARDWLVQFIALNKPLLSKIVVQGSYTWGAKKESLPKGATLEQLASVYKSDVRMSVDVVGCVLKELVTASSQVPVLVAIDQFNALTEPLTAVPDFNNVLVAPEKLSLLRHFRKFILGEHKLDKGAVLLATTTGRTFLSGQLDETSAALLKNAATFVHLPKTKADTVRVNCLPFTDEEAKAFMAYLNAKGWTKSAAATSMAAIKVLTDFVPAKMERLSAAL